MISSQKMIMSSFLTDRETELEILSQGSFPYGNYFVLDLNSVFVGCAKSALTDEQSSLLLLLLPIHRKALGGEVLVRCPVGDSPVVRQLSKSVCAFSRDL